MLFVMNLPKGFIQMSRFVHTTSNLSNLKMAGRNMNKLIKGSNRLKRKWYNPNFTPKEICPTVNIIANPSGQFGKVANRRVTVLNKLFMRHITDQMSSGEISAKLFGRGIEISKIKITTDFQMVNVYWLAKGTPDDIKTEVILNEVAGLLRHQLSQLRLMGNVPKIFFVKDKQLAKVMEVEMQLAQADFGEDHTPIDRNYLLKSEFMLNSKLDSQTKEKIASIESQEEIEEIILPDKSEAIFGLDRELIMKRIASSVKKSKDAWAGNNNCNMNVDKELRSPNKQLEICPVNMTDKNIQLKEFLRLRKIAKRKAEKAIYGQLRNSENEVVEDYENEIFNKDDARLEEDFEKNLYDHIEESDRLAK